MKYLNHILSALLGLPFLIFGLNYFFNFIPMPEMSGQPAAFFGVIYPTKFLLVVKVMEIIFGTMILVNFQRPLALILIAPIVVGILLFELLIAQQPGIAIFLIAVLIALFYLYREHYLPILKK